MVISVLIGLGKRDLSIARKIAAAAKAFYKMKGEDRIAVCVEFLRVFVTGTGTENDLAFGFSIVPE